MKLRTTWEYELNKWNEITRDIKSKEADIKWQWLKSWINLADTKYATTKEPTWFMFVIYVYCTIQHKRWEYEASVRAEIYFPVTKVLQTKYILLFLKNPHFKANHNWFWKLLWTWRLTKHYKRKMVAYLG